MSDKYKAGEKYPIYVHLSERYWRLVGYYWSTDQYGRQRAESTYCAHTIIYNQYNHIGIS